MSDKELIDFVRAIYRKDGIRALSYSALKRHPTLYTTLYHRGLRQSILLKRLGVAEEYLAWKAVQPIRYGAEMRERWTWERILKEARDTQLLQGFLPPAAWWQANGRASLVQAVYLLGHNWETLRAQLDDFQSSQFVEARNGMRWLSHAEASLSNFLYARGVSHRRGERYPEEYERVSGRAYGIYDMHFDGNQARSILRFGETSQTALIARLIRRSETERSGSTRTIRASLASTSPIVTQSSD